MQERSGGIGERARERNLRDIFCPIPAQVQRVGRGAAGKKPITQTHISVTRHLVHAKRFRGAEKEGGGGRMVDARCRSMW